MATKTYIKGVTPPTQLMEFFLLTAFQQGPIHPYGAFAIIREQTGGRLHVAPNTLYSSVPRMVKRGWLEELPGSDARDERRRTYRILPAGEAIVAEARGTYAWLSTFLATPTDGVVQDG